MTGGSANIAFTSMWFHSEMNIAFMDPELIRDWVAKLWCEHFQVSLERAKELIGKPDDALAYFKDQAARNLEALKQDRSLRGGYLTGKEWNAANILAAGFDGQLFAFP